MDLFPNDPHSLSPSSLKQDQALSCVLDFFFSAYFQLWKWEFILPLLFGLREWIYITWCLISLVTTNSLATVVIYKQPVPQNAKMAGLFTAFRINGWGPAVTHRWHFLWGGREKKNKNTPTHTHTHEKTAELVIRGNSLAWQQPSCTTSGGADRHREALASSWHRPAPGCGVVSDSQTGACQAWRLSLLTSVRTTSLLSLSVLFTSLPHNTDLGISFSTAPLPQNSFLPHSVSAFWHWFHAQWFEACVLPFLELAHWYCNAAIFGRLD